ncbi:MAG TPA: hypothetical protein VKW70_07450 [Terriglobia bacterium]|nr:hypothetical protein [Terriglobia bacterium]
MKTHIGLRLMGMIFLAVTVSGAAFAQYGGGTTGGMTGSGGGVYTPPKGGYKSSTGIAIGAGAAAGVGLAYYMLHNRKSVVGCVEESAGGTKLLNEKDKTTYAIDPGNLNLKVGDRVKLSGKKLKSDAGQPTFAAKKLVKDYGSCSAQAALTKSATP